MVYHPPLPHLPYGKVLAGRMSSWASQSKTIDTGQLPFERGQSHERLLGIRSVVDYLCSRMPMSRIVQLVLHHLEEQPRSVCTRVVVNACCIEVEHLPIHHLFRGLFGFAFCPPQYHVEWYVGKTDIPSSFPISNLILLSSD